MTAAPGRFRDAHAHLSSGAVDLALLDLRGVSGSDEIVSRVRKVASRRARGGWIRGWGWGEPPDAASLDRAAPDHPVWLARRDGHAAVTNAAGRSALAVESLVLTEEAFRDAMRRLPPPSDEDRIEAITARLLEAEALGIVEVDDVVEAWGPRIWSRIGESTEIRPRIGLWLPEGIEADEAAFLRRTMPPGGGAVAVRGIKLYLDGTLGGRSAALGDDYADAPGVRGELLRDPTDLAHRARRWAEEGWPVAIHAIGDRAVGVALDVLAQAPPPAWGAHRIEHAQVVRTADLARFARSGVVASVQPGHWADDRPWIDARLGRREGVVVHPLASLLAHGARVVFGSDWPVSTWDPEAVIAAAVDPRRGAEAVDAGTARALYADASPPS